VGNEGAVTFGAEFRSVPVARIFSTGVAKMANFSAKWIYDFMSWSITTSIATHLIPPNLVS
jgi:hypothetical protein